MSLRMRIVSIVAFSSVLGAIISITGFLYFNKKAVESGIVAKARTIHTQLAAATNYVAKQGDLKDVVYTYQHKYKSADQLTQEDKIEILKQVPIYSAMMIGKENQDRDHYKFRVFSDEPRRKENLATVQESEIFKEFQNNPALEEVLKNDGDIITLYRPVRLQETQGCLECHGDPAHSPWKNGTDILGFKMENWTDGKLHGVFAISQSTQAVVKAASGNAFISSSGWLIMAITLGSLLSLVLAVTLMRSTIKALTDAAKSLLEVSEYVNESSVVVADSSNDLSRSSTEQASSLQETATALEQITAMIVKASENAKQAAASSSDSHEKAKEGQHAVEQMIASMDEIKQSNDAILAQVDTSNRSVAEIASLIREIGDKTKVINEIVFQTKLLSFNASVEAARAGEQGKGFAVVAEEVGNLAQMSGAAAKEITEMLDSSVAKVESIIANSRAGVEGLVAEGREKIDSGARVAQLCSESLGDIVQGVSRVSNLSQEISNASREQSQGVSEINNAMSLLDSATQRNANSSEQAAKSAQSLASQSKSLRDSVDALLGVVDGKKPEHRDPNTVAESRSDKKSQGRDLSKRHAA